MSRGIEAFPCWKADANIVVKKLLENDFPLWGIPNEISNIRGTHFTRQVLKQLTKVIQTLWHYHCPYQPQSLWKLNVPMAF